MSSVLGPSHPRLLPSSPHAYINLPLNIKISQVEIIFYYTTSIALHFRGAHQLTCPSPTARLSPAERGLHQETRGAGPRTPRPRGQLQGHPSRELLPSRVHHPPAIAPDRVAGRLPPAPAQREPSPPPRPRRRPTRPRPATAAARPARRSHGTHEPTSGFGSARHRRCGIELGKAWA